MKKILAVLLCAVLLAGFCGFTLRSAGEAGAELVEETLLAPVGVPAAESGEPAGDVAPEPVGEALDASSAEEPASQEAVSQEPAVNGAPASRVIVNAVGMESGKYKTTDGSVVSGFVHGVTTDYVLGFADGVLYLNGYTMTPNGVDYGVVTEGDLTVVLEGSNQLYGAECAIYVENGTLTIRGSGRLTATGDGDGLGATGDLTIEGGIVDAHGTSFDGICSYIGTISIRGTADVTATGGESGLAAYGGNVSIVGSAVLTATGDDYGIFAPGSAVDVSGDATVSATGDVAGIFAPDGSVSIVGNASVTAIGEGYDEEEDPPYSPLRMSALEDGKELVVDPAADGIPATGVGIQAPAEAVTLSCEAVLAGADKAGARRVAAADYLAAMDSYAYVSIPYVAPAPAPTLAPAAKAPATGDGASPLLWLALLAVAGCGLVLLPRKKSRT